MTPRGEDMASAVRRRRERRDRWLREGPGALVRNLGLVGSLGWLLVLPPLAGAVLGRRLDSHYHAGVFWSATFIFCGAVLGGVLVWQKVKRS
ncbi:MAG TPA: AtpZ/AtpI family protein [Polyangia bacterium]|nr:AtpZ/AtpI family protein [Polyangia bacterium]